MTLIAPDDYPAVRAALDTSLTKKMLPDNVIALKIYQGRAESLVTGRDPDAATRTGDDRQRIQRAVIYLTAALIAPAVPQILQSRGQYLSYQRRVIDWEKRAAELKQMAHDEIDELLNPDGAIARPVMFTVARGRRGA